MKMPVSAEIKKEIKIPEGVDVILEGRKITVKSKKTTLERTLSQKSCLKKRIKPSLSTVKCQQRKRLLLQARLQGI